MAYLEIKITFNPSKIKLRLTGWCDWNLMSGAPSSAKCWKADMELHVSCFSLVSESCTILMRDDTASMKSLDAGNMEWLIHGSSQYVKTARTRFRRNRDFGALMLPMMMRTPLVVADDLHGDRLQSWTQSARNSRLNSKFHTSVCIYDFWNYLFLSALADNLQWLRRWFLRSSNCCRWFKSSFK